jgi:four helix bundle protein
VPLEAGEALHGSANHSNAAAAVSKDIADGFLRKSAPQFAQFLDYALGSLAEAEDRLSDGVLLHYFSTEQCRPAVTFAKRCMVAMIRLKQSQVRYARQTRIDRETSKRPPRSKPRR